MPTHIDHVVTEIIPETQVAEQHDEGDKRWQESMKVEALLKQAQRQSSRLKAGGFDD